MENNIKIVRFKDNLDVVCFLEEQEDYTYNISEPMIFEIRNSNLLMQHWLPMGMLKENKVNIKIEDVLCVMDPDNEFAEFYSNTIEKLKTASESKSKDNEIEKERLGNIMETLNQLSNTRNIILH